MTLRLWEMTNCKCGWTHRLYRKDQPIANKDSRKNQIKTRRKKSTVEYGSMSDSLSVECWSLTIITLAQWFRDRWQRGSWPLQPKRRPFYRRSSLGMRPDHMNSVHQGCGRAHVVPEKPVRKSKGETLMLRLAYSVEVSPLPTIYSVQVRWCIISETHSFI
jgi:hypothetical protein